MRKKVLATLLTAATAAIGFVAPSFAYPERPESARVYYEIAYFPCRLVSMVVTTAWDVPTASFQDAIKGSIGGTKMVARNLGNENGTYELIADRWTGWRAGRRHLWSVPWLRLWRAPWFRRLSEPSLWQPQHDLPGQRFRCSLRRQLLTLDCFS